MRLQLAIALVFVTTPALADGTVAFRGVYYKERATRVMQPMLDGVFEAGERGLVNAHFLVDSITSASASAGAADAVSFTETRYEVGGGYVHQLEDVRLGADAKYSTESDYKSVYAGIRAEVDLAQKNTTLGIGGGLGHDTVSGGAGGGLAQVTLECEPGKTATADCPLTTLSAYGSASQILSRDAIVGLSVDLSRLDGYQSNPYRTAVAGDQLVPERHPTLRTRQAYASSLRYYVKKTETTLIGAYRYYRDNWKVHAHTPEIRIVQQVDDHADASFRYRWHTQSRAFFYRDRYDTIDGIDMFVSDDVKLSDTSTHTFEAKLGIFGSAFDLQGNWAGARFEGVLQYVAQYNRFGNAIVAHIGISVPFSY